MIASPTKNEELILYFDYLNTLEWLADQYQKTEAEYLLKRIEIAQGTADFLKNRLEHHNYIEDDEREKRVNKLINTCQSKLAIKDIY